MRFSPAQERGLIILVAIGIIASGVALLPPLFVSQARFTVAPIEVSGARVLLPTFLDSPPKVDLNSAGIDELNKLPGIGDVLAQRIVDYRTEHGPFHSLDELANVSGIGKSIIERIPQLIELGK
ncbi:MAG: helix-hairpin-helix domain-containing protein [Candidatus Bipolaricaulota bacterium]|nr:helix-hairpin-helix domain-containing protein [Candidatus Bipolaricaulota bacterium]